MPRKGNIVVTERITLSTTPEVVRYLGQLTRTGLWGKTAPETAEQIVRDELRRLIRNGDVPKLRPGKR